MRKLKYLLLLLTVLISFQITAAQVEKINVECNLTVNETDWTKKSQLTAILTVKNNSDKKVKINLPPRFLLEDQKAYDDSRLVSGERYSSKEKEEDYIITERRKNGYSYKIRQFFKFSLKSGEARTVEFNLSKLAWNDSFSSILVDFDWFRAIPAGNYNLYYHWSYEIDEDKRNSPVIEIVSNKIGVRLNSEK